jgi:hypothetical protein
MPDRRKVSGEVIEIAGRKQFIDKRIPGSGAFVKEMRLSTGCSCVDVGCRTIARSVVGKQQDKASCGYTESVCRELYAEEGREKNSRKKLRLMMICGNGSTSPKVGRINVPEGGKESMIVGQFFCS